MVFQSVQKCTVSGCLVSIQDLEVGSHVDGSSRSKSLCKSLQMFFSPYQDPGLLGVGKSVPERFSVRMWGRGPIPIEKQVEG